jgi:putative ABC transport system permease protein
MQVERVSASLFPLLGVPAKMGRFTEEEDRPGAGGVILISERLWRTRFGSDADIAERSVKLDEKPYTIIGVMPARFQFPSTDNTFSESVDLWVPMAMTDIGPISPISPMQFYLRVFARY